MTLTGFLFRELFPLILWILKLFKQNGETFRVGRLIALNSFLLQLQTKEK